MACRPPASAATSTCRALILAGSGTYVNLVDNIDNGHRASGAEALYVELDLPVLNQPECACRHDPEPQ